MQVVVVDSQDLAEAIVCQDTAHVLMPGNKPCFAPIPELDLGDRIMGTQPGKFSWRFKARWPAKRKAGH